MYIMKAGMHKCLCATIDIYVLQIFLFKHWAHGNVKAKQLADVEIFCLFLLFSQVIDAE